jgi:hypothetical protein
MLHGCLMQPKVLKAWTQVAHTQISPPNTRILYKGLGSHKEWLGRAQEAIEMLCKWPGTSNPWERESVPFIGIWKVVVGTVRADRSTIPVRPVCRLQTDLGHTQNKSLSDDTIGVGPGHIRRRDGQVRWSWNYNGHIVHRTCLVRD